MRPATRYIFVGISSFAFLASAGAAYTWQQRQRSQKPSNRSLKKTEDNMTEITPFQTLFAVPMTCDGCVKDISGALHKLPGITKVEANLQDQLVTVEGTAPPSKIVETIQATGRDAILRGSGGSNNAAVSILETYHHKFREDAAREEAAHGNSTTNDIGLNERLVRGLARMVQVNPTTTLVDLTVRGVAPGKYRATIREYGDLKDGATSTGPVWAAKSESGPRGVLGTIEIGNDGEGSAFLSQTFQVWEVIGHALVVAPEKENGGEEEELENDENTIVGVIARSAGVWDNDKTVCSCTGKTLWEERKDEVRKGML